MTLTNQEILQINQAIFSLANAYEVRMKRENPPEQTGMTLYDCAVLMVIGQSAPIQSGELARRMDVTPGTISTYVRRLTQKELVRMECDPRDRRVWWLRLTENGQAAYAYQFIIAGTVQYTRDFLTALSEEEQKILYTLLQKTAHSLGGQPGAYRADGQQ